MKYYKYFYWVFTVIFCALMLLDGVGGITKQQAGVDVMIKLGYPIYFMTITGTAKILGALVILINKFKTLKEWAYAGFVFNTIGAGASRLFVGDQGFELYFPLGLLVFILISYVIWKRYEVDFLFID
jgi:hypothetical protein